MKTTMGVLAVMGLGLLCGCSVMEQFHRPTTMDKVPSPVVVTFSRTYPNVTFKDWEERKMYDGTMRYAVNVTDKNKVDSEVVITADGQVVK